MTISIFIIHIWEVYVRTVNFKNEVDIKNYFVVQIMPPANLVKKMATIRPVVKSSFMVDTLGFLPDSNCCSKSSGQPTWPVTFVVEIHFYIYFWNDCFYMVNTSLDNHVHLQKPKNRSFCQTSQHFLVVLDIKEHDWQF